MSVALKKQAKMQIQMKKIRNPFMSNKAFTKMAYSIWCGTWILYYSLL